MMEEFASKVGDKESLYNALTQRGKLYIAITLNLLSLTISSHCLPLHWVFFGPITERREASLFYTRGAIGERAKPT